MSTWDQFLQWLAAAATAVWDLFVEAAPFLLLGLVVAAFARALIRREALTRHLSGRGLRPILKAALIGAPLPLCSCSVLPAAVSMRRQGAGRGATVSFLVSTPETGVDSIAISYGLLDPILTIARPVAAVVSAVVAGLFAERAGDAPDPGPSSCCAHDDADSRGGPSCCATDSSAPARPEADTPADHACGESTGCGCGHADAGPTAQCDGIGSRLAEAFRFTMFDFLPDIAGWFAIGLAVAGILVTAVPQNWIVRVAGGGFVSMLLMLVVGAPLYICATASTPIAAALILQGASPGAALVFLLAGPATNLGSLAVLTRELGIRVVASYLATLAVTTLAAGLAVDAVYGLLQIDPMAAVGSVHRHIPAVIGWGSAAVLIVAAVFGKLRSARAARTSRGCAGGCNAD